MHILVNALIKSKKISRKIRNKGLLESFCCEFNKGRPRPKTKRPAIKTEKGMTK